jgi:hypothetical protein
VGSLLATKRYSVKKLTISKEELEAFKDRYYKSLSEDTSGPQWTRWSLEESIKKFLREHPSEAQNLVAVLYVEKKVGDLPNPGEWAELMVYGFVV